MNLAQKFSLFDDYWSPRIAGELNDSYVKLVKLKGEFVWASQTMKTNCCSSSKGHLTINLRDQDIEVDPGELVIIPRGVEHLPVATEEVHVVLLSRKSH